MNLSALHRFHLELLETYGPQGWWPLLGHVGINPTKTGSLTGYHPGDYTFPRNEIERFEICTGAILTQNTAWPKALIGVAHPDFRADLEKQANDLNWS